MQTMRTIQAELEAGRTVNIFPEGTTFVGDEVRPFHGGAFISAARAGAERCCRSGASRIPRGSDAAFFNETFMNHLARMAKSPKRTRLGFVIGQPFVATRAVRAASSRCPRSRRRHVTRAPRLRGVRAVISPVPRVWAPSLPSAWHRRGDGFRC